MTKTTLNIADLDVFPLSSGQEGLWFLSQLEPTNIVYNVSCAIELQGPVDVDALEKAINEVVRRHEILRTTFSEIENRPMQIVAPAQDLSLKVVDVQAFPPAERRMAALKIAATDYMRPFDYTKGPLLRPLLVRMSNRTHGLFFATNHIVFDNWSLGVLYHELAAFYSASITGSSPDLPELTIQFADYAHWESERLKTETQVRQLDYWKQQLGTNPPQVLKLSFARPRPAQRSFSGGAASIFLDAELKEGLRALGRRSGTTLFMTLAAGYAALLARCSNTTDIVIGSPVANRDRHEIEQLIGYFVNNLVLRIDASGDPSCLELLKRVRQVALEAFAHQDVPFNRVVEAIRPQRSLSHSPLFQACLDLHTEPTELLDLPGVVPNPLLVEGVAAKELAGNTVDLNLSFGEREKDLHGSLEFNAELISLEQAEHLVRQFKSLVADMVAHPEKRISELNVPSFSKIDRVPDDGGHRSLSYPDRTCVHHQFEIQSANSPDSIAVVCGSVQLTYAELNARANQLARHLRELGAVTESRVGLCVHRSIDMVVALLGILKAGAAYVPLDPSYPAKRLSYMLEDSRVGLLVSHAELDIPVDSAVRVVYLDREQGAMGAKPKTNLPVDVHPENLAAVIYTSGSTGRPKGVMVRHQGVSNLLFGQREALAMKAGDRMLQFASLSFDSSLWEICVAIGSGATLVLAKAEWVASGNDLHDLMQNSSVTVAALPPTMLANLKPDLPSLRVLLSAGEACNEPLVNTWGVGRRFINSYGPTETTVIATQAELVPGEGRPPIGRPIANARSYVLDSELQMAPEGASGELYASGDGLARGDLARPELTASRFLPDPFSAQPGARMYRTGDLARHREDGQLEFVGRADHQVKLRGIRIELGEIEAALRRHSSIKDCVVMGDADGSDAENPTQLVAYLIATKSSSPPADLPSYLRGEIPSQMIPSRFIYLDQWPLTENDKVDRRALQKMGADQPLHQSDFSAPESKIEADVAKIWVETLGVERAGLDDSFFELGGNSLLAAAVVAGIRDSYGVEVSLGDLFERPTLRALAANVEQELGNDKQSSPQTPQTMQSVPRDRELPLSLAQERIWFLDRLSPLDASYNIPLAFRLHGPISIQKIEESLEQLTQRHEILRTSFPLSQGRPIQKIHLKTPCRLQVVDLSGRPAAERERLCHEVLMEGASVPFILEQGPLWRTTLVRLSDDEHVLLLTVQHIIADGPSMVLLLNEFATMYQAAITGTAIDLPAVQSHYADFAFWQRNRLEDEKPDDQLAYWRQKLAGDLPHLDFPLEGHRPRVRATSGRRLQWQFSQSMSEEVRALCVREGVTLFMMFVATFKALLHRYTGQDDIIVGTPISNRGRSEFANLVGLMVNTVPLRTSLAGEPTFRDLLKRVKDTAVGAFAHQDLPFERLVNELQPRRDLSRNPFFDVFFVIDDDPASRWKLPGTTTALMDVYNERTKFDLTLWVRETPEGLAGEWEYGDDLFDASTIARLQDHFHRIVERVVAAPQLRVSELSLVSSAEKQTTLVEWNRTSNDFPGELCIHELFETQVLRTPDRVALVVGNERLTFAELNRRAERLSQELRSRQIGPEVRVGICLERDANLLVSLLAVLKAGGAYVPLDPEYPDERLQFLIDDSQASLVLTSRRLKERVPGSDTRVICLDVPSEWSGGAVAHHGHRPTSENAAYVIYTSGSTGQPKGVVITHRNAVNLLTWAQVNYSVDELSGVLASTSASFDLSVFEFFVPLVAGGKVILSENVLAVDKLPAAEEITLINSVPSAITELVQTNRIPNSVKAINLAGEPLSPSLARSIFDAPADCRLINLYAPSETTTYSTFAEVPSEDNRPPSIGRPLANTETFVLDRCFEPIPIRVIGELYLAGEGVARGYLNQPAMTADRFLPHPYSGVPGSRLYRTGDLSRYRKDGELEFLGRRDHQVKLRGFRIELGEIESALEELESVSQAVVHDFEFAPGDRRLVAYLVMNHGFIGSSPELRRYLGNKLPHFLIPSMFAFLSEFPLTPSGKINRRALPNPSNLLPEEDVMPHESPQGLLEERLAEAWQKVLGTEKVRRHDSFFEVGGDSLLAVQLQTRIADSLGITLELVDIFEASTVALLAERAESVLVDSIDRLSDAEAERLLRDMNAT